ncbi:DUF4747 family protein [Bradyrhizobium sp. SYSU BS000235]|uniref:DUF4747 family protein n=1 Tax=Bradyrhizobium sp. SYSU BS000235 TaxID=3411332 RepID=UPI003C7185D3
MAGSTNLQVAALNIVASPHPSGIYPELLRAAAGAEIPIWGSDYAKITSPLRIEDRPGLYTGQILVWAQIDTNGRWLNKRKDVEATAEEMQEIEEALPPDFEPNFRRFTYLLDESEHLLLIEVRNEFGHNLSPHRAERFFFRLMESLPEKWPDVDVTVVPEDDTLEKIFSIPRLVKLEILIKRPNADDVGDDFNRIMEGMAEEGAKSWRIEKIKAPKEKTLKPNDDTKRMAAVAATNGTVSGKGKDESGSPVFESTAEHPKIRRVELITSSFGAVLSALRFFSKAVAKSSTGD